MHPIAGSLALALILTGGCTGVGIIQTAGGGGAPGGGGGGTAPGTGGQGKIPGTTDAEALCTPAALAARGAAPPIRVRRLTNRELQTATALLVDPGAPAP